MCIAGTHICRVGAGTHTAMSAGWVRVELLWGGSGLYLVRVQRGRGLRNSLSAAPKQMNLIISKVSKHVDVQFYRRTR